MPELAALALGLWIAAAPPAAAATTAAATPEPAAAAEPEVAKELSPPAAGSDAAPAPTPPALTRRALCEELVHNASQTQSERAALEAERAAIAKERKELVELAAQVAKSREELQLEIDRLASFLLMVDDENKEKAQAKAAEMAKVEWRRQLAEMRSSPGKTPLDALAKTLRGMKPAEAAKLVEELDPDLAAALLGRMRPTDASPVMGKLPPEVAAGLLAKMANTGKPQEAGQ